MQVAHREPDDEELLLLRRGRPGTARLSVDVEVIITPSCIFYIGNH
jgi:hypothetical protein